MELKDLSRQGLINLITEYDAYVKNICDDEQNDMNKYPVCINEFLNNEFIENKDEKDYKLKVISFAEEISDICNDISIDILNVFEDKLDELDISLPDIHRMGEPNEARIFGETYYEIEDEIKELTNNLAKQIHDTIINKYI